MSFLRPLICSLLLASSWQITTSAAPVSKTETQQKSDWELIKANYLKIEKTKELYERLDLVEKSLAQIENYLTAHPDQPQAYLWRGKINLAFASIQTERGRTAIDYWAFISDIVDPLHSAAYADLQIVLTGSANTNLKAEAHYFMAQYYWAADEPDQELVDQELKLACEGGYQMACKETK